MSHCPPHLVYVSDQSEGYTRIAAGKESFKYLDENTKPIKDKTILKRIERLTIPHIWRNVWVCPYPNGHLQATGKDTKKRKQYIYHEEWTSYRQASKFAKLYEFGLALPAMRKKINQDLDEEEFTYRKTLALAVKLLDCNYLRIGNDIYLDKNETYGLTTLRRKHLNKKKNGLELEYKAKSGKVRKVSITNKILANLLKEANELPGYEIFRYKDQNSWRKIMSEDVNDYIKSISREDFSAKDFRTWGGTITAIDEYKTAKSYVTQGKHRQLDTAIVRRVAKTLGNTVAVARQYYIHPVVLNALTEAEPEAYYTKEASKLHAKRYMKKNEAIALSIMAKAKV